MLNPSETFLGRPLHKLHQTQKLSKEPYVYLQQLPEVVDAPHPYIGLGDLLAVSQRFDPSISDTDIKGLQDEFFHIQRAIVPDEASFIATLAADLNKRLEAVALYEVNRKDKHVGVVIIDRYIASDIDHPSFFRLNISRDKTGKQVPRPGAQDSLSEQYDNINNWRTARDFDEIILMDDAVGVGSTLIKTITELKKELPHQKMRALAGIATSGGEVWSGIEKVYAATGVMTEYLTLQKASKQSEASTGLSICNSRDMTILGGYIQPTAESGSHRRSSPHFLPFTITVPKNFTAPYHRMEAAEMLMDFNGKYVDFLERRVQRTLVMQELADKGFGVPSSNISILDDHFPRVSAETSVGAYLIQSYEILKMHRSTILKEVKYSQRRKG